MLNSILQTLAQMLTNGAILTSTEQIDFSHPASLENSNRDKGLNLYLYDIRINKKMPSNVRQIAEVFRLSSWFDISIIII